MNYCSSLYQFYSHPHVIRDLELYYQKKKENEKRCEDNFKQAETQSNAIASPMITEKKAGGWRRGCKEEITWN